MKKMQHIKSVVKSSPCGICGETDHDTTGCQFSTEGNEMMKQVNGLFYNEGDKRISQYNQNNSNTYNHATRYNHPNFRWRNDNENSNQNANQNQGNGNQNQNYPSQGQSQLSRLEKMMEDFMISQKDVAFKQNKKIDEFSDSSRAVNNRLDLVQTQNRLLETQMAQQAASASRPQGMLPGKPENNPREHVYVVALRSGMQYDGSKISAEEEPKQPVATPPITETEISAASPAAFPKIPAACTDFPGTVPEFPNSQKLGNTDPKKVKSSEKYVPPLRFVHFPQRLVKPKMDQ